MAKATNISARDNGSMYHVVRDWAVRTPDAPAILRAGQEALRYRDLLTAVESIGDQLNALGIGRNDRIAIAHPEGPELAVAILGIWSFATVVPMNPSYTANEFVAYLKSMGAQAVLVPAGMETPARSAAEQLALRVLEFSADQNGPTLSSAGVNHPVLAPESTGPASPDDVATVLLTSGTTADAKVVPMTHRQLVGRGHLNAGFLHLTTGDRALSLMPLFHGGGQSAGLASCLYAGSSVCPLSSPDPESFFRHLDEMRPTYAMGAPTVFHNIRRQADRHEAVVAASRPHIRMIRTGTGQLDHDLAGWLETTFEAPVIQVYGSSEAGWMACDPLPPAPRKPGSVGLTRPGEVAVMDAENRAVPTGVEGEVAARGVVVFHGYENDDTANRSAFVDGWYRTGDLGYFDADGYLFLTGRIKEMINRGGQKISPGEIDDALLAHPKVQAAAAFPVPHRTLGEIAAAAVVLETGAHVEESALLGFLRESLAAYKMPRRLVFVDEIPKSPTGKVQRHKLAAELGLAPRG